MITKRIIPCLDVKDARVVKGVNFGGLHDVSSPVVLAEYYSSVGADELVFYDITSSSDGRKLFTEILRKTAENVFIPLTVGGGIRTLDDFERVLGCGADKVSVNSGAIEDSSIIGKAAQRYGSQCVVLSADIKRVDGKFILFHRIIHSGDVSGAATGLPPCAFSSSNRKSPSRIFRPSRLSAIFLPGGTGRHHPLRDGTDFPDGAYQSPSG